MAKLVFMIIGTLWIFGTCEGAALLGRVPTERWLIPRRTFTKLVMRTDTVTESVASSCYHVSSDLPLCSKAARSISPTATVPILQTSLSSTQDLEVDAKRIADLLSSSSDTTWELLGTKQSDLTGPIEIDVHKHHRYDISGESRNGWGFLGFNIDTTITKIVKVHQTKRILDPNNIVTLMLSGCRPSVLPFHVPLCEEDILPTSVSSEIFNTNNNIESITEKTIQEEKEEGIESVTIATEPLLMVPVSVTTNTQVEDESKYSKKEGEEEEDLKEKINPVENIQHEIDINKNITEELVEEKIDESTNESLVDDTEEKEKINSFIKVENESVSNPIVVEETSSRTIVKIVKDEKSEVITEESLRVDPTTLIIVEDNNVKTDFVTESTISSTTNEFIENLDITLQIKNNSYKLNENLSQTTISTPVITENLKYEEFKETAVTENIIDATVLALKKLLKTPDNKNNNPVQTVNPLELHIDEVNIPSVDIQMKLKTISNKDDDIVIISIPSSFEMTTTESPILESRVINLNEESLKQIEGLQAVFETTAMEKDEVEVAPHVAPLVPDVADTLQPDSPLVSMTTLDGAADRSPHQ